MSTTKMIFLILLFAFCSACHGHQIVLDKPVNRGFYVYAKTSEATYTVIAQNPYWLEAALKEIGCGKQKICAIEKTGDVFRVEQKRK